jgi:p-cumate 2,3-dioxygenase beta subunit
MTNKPSPRTAASRQELEDFLFNEAALLDNLQLSQWLDLFTPDAHYLIPALDVRDAGPQDALHLVMDDMTRLKSRVAQYQGRAMWVENPPARTRRIIANVRTLPSEGDEIRVTANFIVYRIRNDTVDPYIGRYEHVLLRSDAGLRFRERKAILDLEVLRPVGKISIFL